MGEVMFAAAVDRPNWKGLADAVVVVVRDVEPPSMLALVSAGLPNEKTDDASESVLTLPPKENVGCCFDASSVVLAETPKANVGSFLSTAVEDAPKAKVDAGFDGSLNVVGAVVVAFGKLEPNENTDDAGAAVVVTFPNGVLSSTFLAASPNVKLRVLLPLSLVRPDPNVPIVELPKVGIFGASSVLGRVGAVVELAPKLKTGAGFSDVTASAFFSRELAPKANIAGRGAVVAVVVVVDEVVVAG